MEPNARLGQRYRVLKPLGGGAQARVYSAIDELRGREVVIKEVVPGEEPALYREFRLLSQLRHPNLVQVFDLLLVDGRPFLVEERIEGPDFLTWAQGDPSPQRLCHGVAAALRGLQYLHVQGVVHRDIKPDSLRVVTGSIGALPAVRLVDFGLARLRPPAETAGTVEYAAPEVLAGEPASPASDLYSLGVLLYEALTGRLPGLSGAGTARSIQGPEPLRELVEGLLDPRPERRPKAMELVEGLGQVSGAPLHLALDELSGAYFPQAPLVGREAALERVERMIQRLPQEPGGIGLHLTGIGKTAVVRQVRALSRLAGLETLTSGSSGELAADPRLGAPTTGNVEQPDRLATELVDRLLGLASSVESRSRSGLLLCLDGWSLDDLTGTELLIQLSRSLETAEGRGLLLLWTGELPAGAAGIFESIHLGPLDDKQVQEVARRMLWHDPIIAGAPWLDQLCEVTGGDVRLVVELLRAQIEAGLPDELRAPLQLEALARERLATLDDRQRELIAAVAHARAPVPAEILRRVAPASEQELLVEHLLARGFLTVGERSRLAVASLPMRSQARELVDDADRQRLHARYVEAWRASETPADARSIGHHLLGAGEVVEGVRALLDSGVADAEDLTLAASLLPSADPLREEVLERMARLARARGDLERALEIAQEVTRGWGEQGTLLEAELLLDAGQPGKALEALEALATAEPERGPRRGLLAARCHFLLGDFGLAIETVEMEQTRRDQRGPNEDDVGVLLENLAALSLIYTGRPAEGQERLERALPAARELGKRTPEPLARMLNSLGIALQRLGRPREASVAYAECLDLGRQMGDLRFAATAALNLGTLAHRQLDLATALEHYERAATLANRAGIGTTLASALGNEANLRLIFGDLDGAGRCLDRALETARAAGADGLAGHVHLYHGELLLARGDLDSAASDLALARTCFDASDAAGRLAADLLECELALRGEQLATARDLGEAMLERMRWDDPERWRVHLLLGEAALQAGEEGGRTVMHLGLSLAHARRQTGGGEWAFVIHTLLAQAHARSGQTGEAAHNAGRAAALLEELRRRAPMGHRQSFDRSWRVRRAHEALEEIPRSVTMDGGPSAEELARILEINKELNQQRSVDQLLARILECAIELTGAERGFALIEGERGMRVAASRNVDKESVRRGMKKFSRTIARLAIDEDRPIVAADAMDDERFGERLSIHGLKLRAVLCVPLKAGSRSCGALYVDNRFRPDAFVGRHIVLMQAFADQAGIALDAARLLQEAAEHREALAEAKSELEALNHRLEAQLSRQAQELSEISVRLRVQEEELVRRYNAANLVGRSKVMRELFLQIDRVAEASVPVFIWGESGTGKELVARAIHYNNSSRREHPFVTVNCGAIPATLLESELFGHARGAFTGALRDRPGLFEVAGQGTLFLDEVGDMPPDMQVKLLRVLQEGTFRRLGEERERQSHCRVLSASLHQLDALVVEGSFREDLYYRLNVIQLSVPPLSERREDIPLLVEHLLATAVGKPLRVSPSAMAALVDHDWPGNVRQLENELQRSALLCDHGGSQTIELSALSPGLRDGLAPAGPEVEETVGLQESMRAYERRLIHQALEATEYNVSQAADRLGLHRVALHRKMRKLGLSRPSTDEH